MLSISDNVVNEIIIKKSRFITFLYRVDDIDSINDYLSDLNKKYSDATHICYAYILDNVKRFNDNGEPGGTAGMPILNVLESKDLNHVLCCVVRYFGGIKLGANGLVRAYSNSCSEAVLCSNIINLSIGKLCSVSFSYDDTKIIDSLLKDSFITDKKYDSVVSYIFKISSDQLLQINSELSKYGKINILGDCFIEKRAS